MSRPLPLNRFHSDETRNSLEWGRELAGAIELALCAAQQANQNLSPRSACIIAECILEEAAGADATDAHALTDGALEGSPRYRAASRDDLVRKAVA